MRKSTKQTQKQNKTNRSKSLNKSTNVQGNRISNISKVSTGSKLIKKSPKNEIRITKREFIGEVQPQPGWSLLRYEINPGVVKTFPWLSGVAKNFEKYVINKLTIEYRTGQSTFIPGKIQMAPDFDADDPSPASKKELLSYTMAVDGPLWQNFNLTIPKGYLMNQKKYYIRVSEQEIPDKKFYDPCNIFIGCDQTNTELSYLGEIWIDYDITLYEPQSPSFPVDFNVLGKYYLFNSGDRKSVV